MRHRCSLGSSLLIFLLFLLSRATPANAQCVQGNFFVSTSVAGFFPGLAPPNGFCVVDNGAGDSDPATGVIRFSQTVSSPATGTKIFTGAARIVPGIPVSGGINQFGVELFDFQEETLSVPSGPALAIPIFVQNTFAPDIPSPAYAAVTTSLMGFASSVTVPFSISDLGSWSGVPVVSSGHILGISSANLNFSPPPAVSPFAPGLGSPEVVTYQYQSTARPTGTRVNVTSGSAIVGAPGNATDCNVGRFFVSTFIENFFTNLMPPAGFCVPDNGPGDLEPAVGVIVFDQTVSDPIGLATKRFSGRAEIVPGSATAGGTTGFGVLLTDFEDLTLGSQLVIGAPAIPVFVQNTVSPGIPAGAFGRVTTTLDGFASGFTGNFSVADLGSWAGSPVVSSGHILGVPPAAFAPIAVTSPPGSGARSQEVVTYQYISTNREAGVSVVLPGSGRAVVNLSAGPANPALTLLPQVSTNPVGNRHTVTATLTPAMAGVAVTFTVLNGPHAGVTGMVMTDAFGNASFNYQGNAVGRDAIQATAPGGLVSNIVTKDWVPDDQDPICQLVGSSGGTLRVRVQDYGTGLRSVDELLASNAAVNTPAFPVGTTAAQIVTATKIDPSQPSRVELRVTDVAGNDIECDPVHVVVARSTGRPEPVVLTGLPQAEGRISLRNGAPGVKNLEIEVNGRTWRITGLADGAERELDISSAMRPGDANTIVLTSYGEPGGSVEVLVSE